jgi:hypothetical protein
MNTTPEENTHVSDTPLFEPFPEPQTMPSGWDLSAFTHDSGYDVSPWSDFEVEV